MEQVWEVLYEYTCKIAILMTPHRLPIDSSNPIYHFNSNTLISRPG